MGVYNTNVFEHEGKITDVKMNASIDGEIVFHTEDYNKSNELFEDMKIFISLLMKYDYTCQIYKDEVNIFVVKYSHDENIEYYGGSNLCWLTDEEWEDIKDKRLYIEEQLNKNKD